MRIASGLENKCNHFIILRVKPVRQGRKLERHLRCRFTKTFLNLANSKRISTAGRKTDIFAN